MSEANSIVAVDEPVNRVKSFLARRSVRFTAGAAVLAIGSIIHTIMTSGVKYEASIRGLEHVVFDTVRKVTVGLADMLNSGDSGGISQSKTTTYLHQGDIKVITAEYKVEKVVVPEGQLKPEIKTTRWSHTRSLSSSALTQEIASLYPAYKECIHNIKTFYETRKDAPGEFHALLPGSHPSSVVRRIDHCRAFAKEFWTTFLLLRVEFKLDENETAQKKFDEDYAVFVKHVKPLERMQSVADALPVFAYEYEKDYLTEKRDTQIKKTE